MNIAEEIEAFDKWLFKSRWSSKKTFNPITNEVTIKYWLPTDNVRRRYITTQELYDIFKNEQCASAGNGA